MDKEKVIYSECRIQKGLFAEWTMEGCTVFPEKISGKLQIYRYDRFQFLQNGFDLGFEGVTD